MGPLNVRGGLNIVGIRNQIRQAYNDRRATVVLFRPREQSTKNSLIFKKRVIKRQSKENRSPILNCHYHHLMRVKLVSYFE